MLLISSGFQILVSAPFRGDDTGSKHQAATEEDVLRQILAGFVTDSQASETPTPDANVVPMAQTS